MMQLQIKNGWLKSSGKKKRKKKGKVLKEVLKKLIRQSVSVRCCEGWWVVCVRAVLCSFSVRIWDLILNQQWRQAIIQSAFFFFLLPRWADSNKYILILRHKFLPLETSLASRTGLVFRWGCRGPARRQKPARPGQKGSLVSSERVRKNWNDAEKKNTGAEE